MGKSELVRQYIVEGKWKEALKIGKDFRLGVTRTQRDCITRAYECMVHPDFYRSIGKNLEQCIDAGKSQLAIVVGLAG